MKRYAHRLFIAVAAIAIVVIAGLAILLLFGGNRASDEPVKYRSFSADGGSKAPGPGTDAQDKKEKLSSAIQPEPNETLLDLYSYNLDLDDEEEQILLIKKSDAPDSPVRIVLADFSSEQRRWVRAWEGETAATKIKTVRITVKDLIGDRNQDIICSGMNDSNKQTLSVFWRDNSGPSFNKIFESAADSVVIEETERPESYKLGQTNGESWAITTYDSDPASANFLDQVKKTWSWSFPRRSYVLSLEERIPGAKIAAKMSQAILDGKSETFERFLAGIWYRDTAVPETPEAQFITFQPSDRSLFFAGDGAIELYDWETSNPTRFGLYVACRNQSVRDLRRLMNIELTGADTITVSVFQDLRMKADVSDRWNGSYRKLGNELASSLRKPDAVKVTALEHLEGTFVSSGGEELFFAVPRYTRKKQDGSQEEGSFSVFRIGADSVILDMKSIPAPGTVEKGSRFSFEATLVERNENKISRYILSLKPVRIGMSGATATEDPIRTYERIKTR